MARLSLKRYNAYVLALMAVYIALMLWLWPHAKAAPGVAWKVVFALSPLVPVACVIVLMARRVMQADELDQRLHLVALGVATALVGTGALVASFLAMAKVWQGDGSELFWVFPALGLIYSFARMGLKWHFTGSWSFWDC
ncbi:MAG TPA: hypothetical protein VFH71_02275 [Rhodanobacteraceae bacterium]|nr:hypothetical protein [Rhodanobacteraceae bacterium]